MSASWIALLLSLAPPPPRVDAGGGADVVMAQLERRADGGYEHRDRRAGFRATIAPDGSVTFRDLDVGPVDFAPIVVLGIDFSGGTPNIPDPSRPSNTLIRPQDLADLGDDPLVKNGPYGPGPVLIHARGSMAGISDRVLAQRSRHANAKRRFLEQTEALRSKLAAEHRRATERAALASLEAELHALWDAADTPAALRREQIFRRWDDCVELPDDAAASAEQRARGRAGERARRRIAAWVREHLPRASVDAFTADELRAMNARRRSRVAFDPYADPQGPRAAGPPADATSSVRTPPLGKP